MDESIAKLIRFEAPQSCLDRWLAAPAARGRAAPAPAAGSRDGTPGTAGEPEPGPMVEIEMLEAYRSSEPDGDSSFLNVLVDRFLRDASARIETMRRAVQTADAATLTAAAHALKGSAATLGARHLAGLCGALEDEGAAPEPRGAEGFVDRVEAELARVREALEVARLSK